MSDFFDVVEYSRGQTLHFGPSFRTGKVQDLMIRGGKFYAVYNPYTEEWTKSESDMSDIVDAQIWDEVKKRGLTQGFIVDSMKNYSSGSWTKYKKYIRESPDHYVKLDRKLTFSNTKTTKKDYVSKSLSYPLEDGPHDSYEKIISTLYEPEERAKIEWAIGSIVAGDSVKIQKFFVFYGKPGSGKSTILHIIEKLFDGYYTTFDAKSLGSNGNQFAAEVFRDGPLVAIQHDGDLSRIEDNTKINSIVSHELMAMNVKHQSAFTERMDCMLFMGTNKEVKITDAKSGILRRLIDIHPSGNTIPIEEFTTLEKQIPFELSGIAWHCLQVYKEMGKNYYLSYKPFDMLYKSNAFYNFVESNYDKFKETDYVTLKTAWEMYKTYCDDAALQFKMPMYVFGEELKNYFVDFKKTVRIDGRQLRSVYMGFKTSEFVFDPTEEPEPPIDIHTWLEFEEQESVFDKVCKDCPAQYTNKEGNPTKKWANVKTTLKDLDTKKLHYVKVPENHIVIDFDIKDKEGNKSLELNTRAASDFPKTYAELSKSGSGIHLHYIYKGDVTELSHVYGDDIEIKVFTGNSSLRRKLTRCNNIDISELSSGLPKKETKKVINFEAVRNEQQLRALIEKNLRKEVHPNTAPSVDFIAAILDEAYESGRVSYDIRDMRKRVKQFAMQSTHQAEKCYKVYQKMHFVSSDIELKEKNGENPFDIDIHQNDDAPIVFFDIEVFPNLFVVAFKERGPDKKPVYIINPTQQDIAELLKYRLIGFNNKRYDNHIIYGRLIGENNEQCFERSQRIIVKKDKNAFFSRAYDISYADVLDFVSKKQSLKKYEIDLGINHVELNFKWDEPVPEKYWTTVAEYCMNDVIATEATFDKRSADWTAREILSDITGLSPNASTNTMTTKIIVGDDPNPQSKFVYTDLSKIFKGYEFCATGIDKDRYIKDEKGKPIYTTGKSIYMGEDPSEGGYVYAEPGIYYNVAVVDLTSAHITGALNMNIFGPYTRNLEELYNARVYVKHKDFGKAAKLFDGKLRPYLKEESAKDLSYALKIAINSVYGLTSAKFDNKLRDPRNVDNIVAKRVSLFMISLKHAVQEQGFEVVHIKTDSIKIADATPAIIQFVMDYGKNYGYSFEHESTYERMCLVNDAVYIARYSKDSNINGDEAGKWTATGAQFKHPYVFKKLFTKEQIEFKDMCETKAATSALYLDFNEDLPEGEHNYIFVGKVGSFCPVESGAGGGILLREQNDKYYAANGTKGYRWLEAARIKDLGKEDQIDKRYFAKLVDDAIDNISKYGDFYEFVDEDSHIHVPKYDDGPAFIDITSDELPF